MYVQCMPGRLCDYKGDMDLSVECVEHEAKAYFNYTKK